MRLTVLAALLAVASPLAAQTNGRFLSLSDWTAPYVEQLIRAGVIADPDPLTRPLRRADVARALAAVDTASLRPALRGTVAILFAELAQPDDSARWRIDLTGGALVASDARRDPVRPAADSAGFYPQGTLSLALEFPRLTMVSVPRIENRLRYDPDYRGKKDRFIAGRIGEAYAATSWRYFEAFFGSLDRNWGSPETEGLLLSPNPYSFDHLMLRLGPRRLRIEFGTAQLDPLPLWDSSQPVNRFLAMHRLVAEPSASLTFSLAETAVYAQTGGIPRGFEPWYLNPLNLFLLQQYDGATTANALLAADVAWRPRGSLRLYGQLYLDDFQVDDSLLTDSEPPAYGFTLSAAGGAGGGAAAWSLLYTRITNLAYRTPANEEQYSFRGIGIARNFADYDQATARITLLPAPLLLMGGEITLLRQGEGHYLLRYPAESLYVSTPTFLQGNVERTVRVAASARWTPARGIDLAAEAGRHFVSNAGNVAGANGDRWVWRLSAGVRRTWSGRFDF